MNNTGWKIYFWVYSIFEGLDIVTSIFNFHSLSIGDYIDRILSVTIAIALFAFAYNKKIVSQLYWRIYFWLIMAYISIQIIYSFTPWRFASNILLGKYTTQVYNQVPVSLSIAIGIPCTLLCLPIFYVLFALAYKNVFKKEKMPENKDLKTSGLSIASLVLGLSGLIFGPLTTIPAFITGVISLFKIKKGKVKGSGLAWTGITIFIVQSFFIYWFTILVVYIVFLPGLRTGYQDAVKHMSPAESKFYNEKLSKIKQDSDEAYVVKVLGKPKSISTIGNATTYQYSCPDKFTLNCSYSITITDHAVSNIYWMDLKRFYFTRTFTDLDKTYYFDNYDVTFTLQPGWSEYTYSADDLKKDPNPPLTFTRVNGTGVMYADEFTLDKPFDINDHIKSIDLGEPVNGVKKSVKNGVSYYELEFKKDKDFYNMTYIVKPDVALLFTYYNPNGAADSSELSDVKKTIATADAEKK